MSSLEIFGTSERDTLVNLVSWFAMQERIEHAGILRVVTARRVRVPLRLRQPLWPVRRRLHRAGEDEVRQELGTVVLRLPQRRRAPAGETLRIGKILIWRRRLEDEQLTTLSVPKKPILS